MSLFVLASKDGWVDIMYDGLDAVGVDQQVGVLVSHCQKPRKEACLFWRLLFLKKKLCEIQIFGVPKFIIDIVKF